jgi:hypothetical protein
MSPTHDHPPNQSQSQSRTFAAEAGVRRDVANHIAGFHLMVLGKA